MYISILSLFFYSLSSFNLELTIPGNARSMASTVLRCRYVNIITLDSAESAQNNANIGNNCFSLAHKVIQVKIIGFFYLLKILNSVRPFLLF